MLCQTAVQLLSKQSIEKHLFELQHVVSIYKTPSSAGMFVKRLNVGFFRLLTLKKSYLYAYHNHVTTFELKSI